MEKDGDAAENDSKSHGCVSAQVPFLHLCTVLEKVQKNKLRHEKANVLKEFINSWRSFHAALHQGDANTSDSFYAGLRLILPQLERSRLAYGIKENMLAKMYIELLGLPKNGPEANKLLNYKGPSASRRELGDFACTAYFVLKKRCSREGVLTIKDVNDCLDAVAISNARKQKEQVKKSILRLITQCSALEQKWLIRMIVKDMKLGLRSEAVLQLFHADAPDLYSLTTDLSKVCRELHDPSVSLGEMSIQLFSAFKPMLAAVGSLRQVEKALARRALYIETKLDGERVQLHKDGEVYKYFTRNSYECTQNYASLTPHIHKAFGSHVLTCILDGEMMAYCPTTDSFIQKGSNVRRTEEEEGVDVQSCFCVFDVLLVNGQKWGHAPLVRRYETLRSLFAPSKGHLQWVDQSQAGNVQDVVDALNQAIDNREEGIMIKDPGSVYKPDKRGEEWLKVKPEYVDGLMDELDLLIVGGYWGKGKRSGMLSHFLCAVADSPGVFRTLCRVGSGYTLKELYNLSLKLAKFWKVYDKNHPPPAILCGLEKPEVYIEPQDSLMVQVKAAEIVPSEMYGTKCTLRFPRIERIRDDKAWHQCTSFAQLQQLRSKASGKLASRHLRVPDQQPEKKQTRKSSAVAGSFRAQNLSAVPVDSDLFADVEFCVVNGSEEHSKAQVERAVARCGGVVVQNPGSDTYCVIASTVNMRVKNLVASDRHDVVRAEWLFECVEKRQVVRWQPRHMIHMSPSTREIFEREYDRHYDSYFVDGDEEQLRDVFGRIARVGEDTCRVAEVEMEYGLDDLPTSIFRNYRAFFHQPHSSACLDIRALQFRLHGGTVVKVLEDGDAHLVVGGETDLPSLKTLRRRFNKKFKIVRESWVSCSIKAGHAEDVTHYLL